MGLRVPGEQSGGTFIFAEKEECCGCGLGQVVTGQEEAILAKMRELKDQVRPLVLKMKTLQSTVGESSHEVFPEFAQLSTELENLRLQWKEWEQKLEDAIEAKLIMLGHRNP